ncbi:hypothetical protein EGI26_21020 [Lacihabitans sp. CCS-44]|uniref:hypothetical protein n=1 Tax=Lacihabitans sp. CCS-44 TaxID=2487331 RepID=UPI0020CD026A|nr:hypothetical protein [Lacihabitans sp. CCS-44]MCP9757653.1 hypothetical protein [Lacihabitans sp. CCS-44]
MKNFLFLFLTLYCAFAFGQNQGASITINLPNKPSANTADWTKSTPPVTIILQGKGPVSQEKNPKEFRVFASIKIGDQTVCGKFNSKNAPSFELTTPVKTWSGASALGLLGDDCVLKPGQYQFCVQVFNIDGRQVAESCKPFTIEEVKQVSYTAPNLVFPADGKTLTQAEENQAINFRWTPILPKPNSTVKYRVVVFDVLKGQTLSDARKRGEVLFEKEIENQTQMRLGGPRWVPRDPPVNSDQPNFGWYVEARELDGKVLAISETAGFKIIIDDPSQGCFEIDTSSYKIECKGFDLAGKPIYHISNLILKNIGTNNGKTGLNGFFPTQSYITPFGFTVSNLTPAPQASILTSGSVSIGFDINGSTASSVSFNVNSTIPHPTNPSLFCDKIIGVTLDLPLCYCKDCENVKIIDAKPIINTATLANPSTASFNLTGNVTAGPNPIYGFEVQLESLTFSSNPGECSDGISLVSNSGVITNPLVSGTSTSIFQYSTTPGLSSLSKAFKWKPSSPTNAASGIPFSFNMNVPPKPAWAIQQNCCTVAYKACFKVIVEYAPCKYCTYFMCKEFKY